MSQDALIVGINTYDYADLNGLTKPAEDAEAVARLLSEWSDFKVRRLPDIKNKGEDAERYPIRVGRKTKVPFKALQDALIQLFTPEGDNIPDTALFYFSGHGFQRVRGPIREGYLATSDAIPESDNNNWGLSLKFLRELLQASPIRQQIIWLDCCYSGELLNFAEANPGDRGQGRDRCFIAASREFEMAYEETTGNHGVLTGALLQGLDPKRCPDRWVTNYALVNFLSQELRSVSQRPIFTNFGAPINLTRQLQSAVARSVASPHAICPYKGLAYFDCNEEDPKYFYGREKLTDRLLDRVRQGSFLAILGASGSGKSSVLRAGLLHQLKLGRKLSGTDQWEIRILQPGEHPLQSLALAFLDPNLSAVERAKQLADAEALIAQGADGLRRLVQASANRVVLVIDQFEEAFTLCRDGLERQKFFACLLGALDEIGASSLGTLHTTSLQVIIAMRADFFGKCVEQDYSGLSDLIEQNLVTVTPMTAEELRQAIELPAKRVELAIEQELVTQMLADVAEAPGSLPLLQYTLTELWTQRSDNCLRLNTYAQLGGVMGTLRKRATTVYESFSEKQQAATRQIFLSLTQLGEGTEDTRRRVQQSDLVTERYSEELMNEVIQQLADQKLIVTSEGVEKGGASGRVVVVDVVHEALIRHWNLLRGWLDECRDALKKQRTIEEDAKDWQENGKREDYLLTGLKLIETERFVQQYANMLSLSARAKEFIQISQKVRRSAQIKTRLAITLLLLIAAFFVRLAWQMYTQSRMEQLIRDARQGVYSSEHLKILPKVLEEANKYRKKGDADRALADYRDVLAITSVVMNKINQRPNEFQLGEMPKLQKTSEIVREEFLANVIVKYRLPELTKELRDGRIGGLRQDAQLKQFENQYKPGALQTTYSIIQRDFGVGADLNNNGYIQSREEANRIPCKVLREIRDRWQKEYKPQCGWANPFQSTSLPCYSGKTLTELIFAPPYDLPVERLQTCKVYSN